ncbi:MAG TPA: endonuclease/exonuclease/phosphatase family protein, partial [Terriglobales bacterium]|nr:endonuclease/exonuclease/phosphatase family protein [Terriglobales bacterium]
MSLNLHAVREGGSVLDALQRAKLENTELMLFQEVVRPRRGGPGPADDLAHALGMQISFSPSFRLPNGDQEGLAILSRHPIVESRTIPLRRYNLLWKSRHRVAQSVILETPAGPLHVYNLHLDTRVNLKARLAQMQPVVEEAAAQPGPVLVGGDLNTNPYRWVEHTLPLLIAPDQGVGVLNLMNSLGYSS